MLRSDERCSCQLPVLSALMNCCRIWIISNYCNHSFAVGLVERIFFLSSMACLISRRTSELWRWPGVTGPSNKSLSITNADRSGWGNYTPASTKLKGGYTGITLSVCPPVRPSVCPSVDRIVSALYLHQYSSDPFYICTSYQATSEGVSRVMPVSKF